MSPSMADGAMFLPPAVMIRSFLRPVILRKPFGVDLAEVASELPAVGSQSLGGFGGHLVVLAHDVAASVEDLAVVADLLVDARPGRPDPAESVVVVSVEVGERGVFGHPDALNDQNPSTVEELGDFGVQRRGARDAPAHPAAEGRLHL